ncbi:MAG: ATP-binding protein [Lachnospiraceae bacterium]|nr:ATP-binding protein [Lachnospiraceae bacterium]
MFTGRESELSFLKNHYTGGGSRILVVYGRKGVGKTALLRRFSEDKKWVYYMARSCSEREQRYQWARELDKAAQEERFPSYRELLGESLDGIEKGILIIDEFHHLVKTEPSFIQELIQYFKENAQKEILVILCSSASGWIENSMVSKIGRSALALSGLLKVRELRFAEMRRLFSKYSMEDALKIYAILGGNPGLWNSFSEELSADENVKAYLLPADCRLQESLSISIAEELRETAVYNTILSAMAGGVCKLNDLYLHTGFSRAKISVYLKNLMELDLVEKVNSFQSAGYENTQKGIYRIANPCVHFYFRFLYPYQSAMMKISSEEFFEQYLERELPDFMKNAYRKVCTELLSEEYASVGEWIGKKGNIDVIARRGSGELMCGMCVFGRKVTAADYRDFEDCLKKAKLQPSEIRFFCENGAEETFLEMKEAETVRLDSLRSRFI